MFAILPLPSHSTAAAAAVSDCNFIYMYCTLHTPVTGAANVLAAHAHVSTPTTITVCMENDSSTQKPIQQNYIYIHIMYKYM